MPEPLSFAPGASDPKLKMRVLKTHHDLHTAIGHVLGFGEMLLEEAQEQSQPQLVPELERLVQNARHVIAQINEELDVATLEKGLGDLVLLQDRLCAWSDQVVASIRNLTRNASSLNDEVFRSDLVRIEGAAIRTRELANTSLAHLMTPSPGETAFLVRAVNPLLDLLPARSGSPQTFVHSLREGLILIVDDLAENRELLSRRLSRIGYSVQMVDNGQSALQNIELQPPDLILLDILMPDMDGFEVLRRLKANPFTQHIPIIMLSSADQPETAVRCIELGADDFLPKPFNATLLTARMESCLAKKRLRDQETAFLHRLQTERDISERLLLNILPKEIADRLKLGEKVIADSFAEVTILFSDFVGFTKLASATTPKALVTRLNEIFSAFDDLCQHHGLEKIKMIGDAYMAVAGLPTPRAAHAQAAADLALAMQQEIARLANVHEQPLRMRVGLNSGPVVAGVIGVKKFAYDLWGDAVNLASRMEAHAPSGGILVTAATYERLRDQYLFQPGRVIRVKGKGEVLTYRLIGKSR